MMTNSCTRIGIVSDTHGHVGNTRKACVALAAHDVSQVIHCGDIGSTDVVFLFVRWPTHFVFGNCDHNEAELASAIAIPDQSCHGAFGSIDVEGERIAFLHGHDHRRLQETIASQEFRLVCYGHTHEAEHHFEGETLVLNPGALYRANRHTIAVVEFPSLTVTSVEIT